MCRTCVIELEELLRRNRCLENENAHLRTAVQQALCGVVFGPRSCQLPRNHGEPHRWASPDDEVVITWE